MMRRRGPGLARTVARTAVVAGTASAVSGRVHRRQDERWAAESAEDQAAAEAADAQAMQAQMAAMQAQQAQAAMQQSGGGGDLMVQLQRLTEMRDSGVLNDDEFAAAKAKLLR